jgi:hypothetical protein
MVHPHSALFDTARYKNRPLKYLSGVNLATVLDTAAVLEASGWKVAVGERDRSVRAPRAGAQPPSKETVHK